MDDDDDDGAYKVSEPNEGMNGANRAEQSRGAGIKIHKSED